MDIRFDGNTVVVTGGARGIGYACAELMVESGAKVAIVDILGDVAAYSVKKLQSKGIAKSYHLDLSKVCDISAVITQIRNDLGEIDVLVQAAGLLRGGPAVTITEAEWDSVLNVNTKGLFFMMQAVASQSMIPCKTGSIVNFASMAGIRGMHEPMCSAHYSASKGAVVALTMQAAVEWAKHNIRVNAVAPGGVKSGAIPNFGNDIDLISPIPLKRLSETSDVASGVYFLASNAANMVTGQVLIIDGGSSVVGY
jgi:NAD(P)-dependent dehydrogenase (short-subunit alcohol dehydrogenase family)